MNPFSGCFFSLSESGFTGFWDSQDFWGVLFSFDVQNDLCQA